MPGSNATPVAPVPPVKLVAFTVVRDGFMSGLLPGYRVVTVATVGQVAKVTNSPQKYLLGEALALVEEKTREGLQL